MLKEFQPRSFRVDLLKTDFDTLKETVFDPYKNTLVVFRPTMEVVLLLDFVERHDNYFWVIQTRYGVNDYIYQGHYLGDLIALKPIVGRNEYSSLVSQFRTGLEHTLSQAIEIR